MKHSVEHYTELFKAIYVEHLTKFGITDSGTIQSLLTILTLSLHAFVSAVKAEQFQFKTRGKYGKGE